MSDTLDWQLEIKRYYVVHLDASRFVSIMHTNVCSSTTDEECGLSTLRATSQHKNEDMLCNLLCLVYITMWKSWARLIIFT